MSMELITKLEREARIARLSTIAGRCGTLAIGCGRSDRWYRNWTRRCDAVLALIRKIHRAAKVA